MDREGGADDPSDPCRRHRVADVGLGRAQVDLVDVVAEDLLETGELGPIERGPMYGNGPLEGQWRAWAGRASKYR